MRHLIDDRWLRSAWGTHALHRDSGAFARWSGEWAPWSGSWWCAAPTSWTHLRICV